MRFIRNLFYSKILLKFYFPQKQLSQIENFITESESKHRAEICFVAESSLNFKQLLRGINSRERAIEIFSEKRVWDTEENSGVLLYLLLADKKIEIIADRGVNRHVGESKWAEICEQISIEFQKKEYSTGVLIALKEISYLLEKYYPIKELNKKNELSNKPIIL
jgi:uncharacterized membrane protein